MSGRWKPGRFIECACCGQTGRHAAHGWRVTCYDRWRRHGKPAGGPPPPMTLVEIGRINGAKPSGPRLERIEDFVLVLKTRPADTAKQAVAQAAAAVGRCERTGWRYITSLREQGVTLRDLLNREVPL